jgi:uncharacterized surface protein with fasciclin (FAS1) repeats
MKKLFAIATMFLFLIIFNSKSNCDEIPNQQISMSNMQTPQGIPTMQMPSGMSMPQDGQMMPQGMPSMPQGMMPPQMGQGGMPQGMPTMQMPSGMSMPQDGQMMPQEMPSMPQGMMPPQMGQGGGMPQPTMQMPSGISMPQGMPNMQMPPNMSMPQGQQMMPQGMPSMPQGMMPPQMGQGGMPQPTMQMPSGVSMPQGMPNMQMPPNMPMPQGQQMMPPGMSSMPQMPQGTTQEQPSIPTAKDPDNIIGKAMTDPNLSSFMQAVQSAGQFDNAQMTDKPAPFIVFAPNNAAFKTAKTTLTPQAKKELKALIKYLVCTGVPLEQQIKDSLPSQIETLAGAKITINADKTVSKDNANILYSISCSNGTIHVIDKVLTPTK